MNKIHLRAIIEWAAGWGRTIEVWEGWKMPEAKGLASTYVAEIGSLEDQLKATLMETADDMAHTESFDSEQRAEIYTIIKTLKANTDTHRAMVELLTRKLKEGRANA